MDLNYTAEELAFRDQVRAFVRDSLPRNIARKVLAGAPGACTRRT